MKLSKDLSIVVAMMTVMMVTGVQQTQCARILMAVPIGTKSHNNFFMPIAEHLAQRNHTVTYVTGYEQYNKSPNIEIMVVPGVKLYEKMHSPFTNIRRPGATMLSIYDDMRTICVEALAYKGVQSLMEEKFDLIILHAALTECFLLFVHKLKVPFIFVNPNKIAGAFAPITGSPPFPSLAPSFLMDRMYPLTFTGRMRSTLHDLLWRLSNDWILIPSQDRECRTRKLCPDDMPSFGELRLNSSLFITNSIRTTEHPPLPYTPTVVHAGGIHCRPAKPLPLDLQEWVAGAGKPGFIFFSLGSLVKPSTMPEKYRNVLLVVFGSLQQRVLWKWDEDIMEGLPSNVRLSKWLPQQDILGHPQLRLFITHGGLLSIHEATYHGVPILGIPLHIDQKHNMKLVEKEGWGKFLYWEDLTYDSLLSLIQQLMSEPRLRDEAQRRATVMRDQPVAPGDWATYWIEYVLRHEGARHLRCPALDISWYQLYNTDVWALIVMVTVVAVALASWLSYRILSVLTHCCCRSRKAKKD